MKKTIQIILVTLFCTAVLCSCGIRSDSAFNQERNQSNLSVATLTRQETMSSTDGSIWSFTHDNQVTVANADGTEKIYRYTLTKNALQLIDSNNGETVVAFADCLTNGDITIYFQDQDDIVLSGIDQ